jgi:phosphoribosylaminoimidazole-succinocarboxamide synthase
LRTGKVRDLYTNESGELLIVASDRISAFDWVLPTLIPNKGAVLTQISLWWFEQLKHLVPNHIIGTDANRSCWARSNC